MKHAVAATLLFAAAPCICQVAAEPVAAALGRPALAVRAPERSVMLAAAAVGSQWVAVGERGLVLRSEDEGRHWQQSPVPVSVTLTAVRFADQHHGIAVGHGGTVLTTGDGGRSWSRRLDGRRIAELLRADAKARNDAAAIKAAEQSVADGPDKPLLDVLAMGPRRALAVGAYGLALETEDGGNTWTSWASRLDNPRSLHLYAVRQRGDRIVIAGEQGLVLKSDNGGHTFQRVATPYKGSFFTAELPRQNEILLAGLRGNAWKSGDGGATWTQLATPAPASFTASAMDAQGRVWLGHQAGSVFSYNGEALVPMPIRLPPLTGLLPVSSGRAIALSISGIATVTLGTPK